VASGAASGAPRTAINSPHRRARNDYLATRDFAVGRWTLEAAFAIVRPFDSDRQARRHRTMPEVDGYRTLLTRAAAGLAVGLAAVVVCFFWIDVPVAYYVHRHQINHIEVFRLLTLPPPIVQAWSPLVLALLMVYRAWRPFARWQLALLAACLSMIVADEFRTSLGDASGRYWPETWFDNNPSLISNGIYGFHPFQRGDDVGSFPSGHAARIVGFAAVWWIAFPRSWLLCALVCLPMLVSLVAMNYHFVGDVIAGSVLGGIVAAYAAQLAGLRHKA
jgi:membrane-associated phospholipid phosphatase